MKAIIPVAGHGTRLEPHTHKLQKCLLPVAGKPVLAHIMERLVAADVSEITLIIGHLGEQVKKFCQSYSQLKFNFVEQKERLGLGHAVYQGLENGDEPVIISLGDAILELDYQSFLKSNSNVIGVAPVPDPERFGIVETEGNQILKFWEKPANPPSNLAIIGVYFINSQKELAKALEHLIENDIRSKNEYQLTDALTHMLESGQSFTPFEIDQCLDCGIPETLLETNRILLEREGESVQHPSAEIIDSEINHSTISEKCRVENAKLENVIMLPGSKVSGNTLNNTILGFYEVVEAYRHKLKANSP